MVNQEMKPKTLTHIITPSDAQIAEDTRTEMSPVSFAQCVRTLHQNWRQGTVACKDRGEVTSRSNKKPWKQKGTGRARAGSPRSPLWRGGGVTFGPQERVRTLKTSKALRNNVLKGLLWQRLDAGSIISLNWQPAEKPKTADLFKVLKDHALSQNSVVFFVATHDYVTHASLANIAKVRMLLFDQPNVYSLAAAERWVFLEKDIDLFKKMVSSWI